MSENPVWPDDGPDPAVEALAAVTDAELAADIHAAVREVAERAARRRRQPDWRNVARTEHKAHAAAEAVRAALAELGEDAPLAAVEGAVGPILRVWWDSSPAAAQAVSEAVDRLRATAMRRPALVRQARYLTRHR